MNVSPASCVVIGAVLNGREGGVSPGRAVFLIANLLLLIGAWGCGEPPPVETPVRPVLSVRVGDGSALSDRRYPGQARATQELNMAFEVAGRLIERPVDVGSIVELGGLLARLDPRDFEADLARARANEAKDRADSARAVKLLEEGVMPPAQHEAFLRRHDVSKAELRKAEKATEDTELIAPFSGTVAATFIENFQNVQAKQPVLRLLDTTSIEMVINMPEQRIHTIPYVTWVKVQFDVFPDHEIDARVKEVGNESSPTTRTYPITLIFDPPTGVEVKPGMSGHAWAGVEFPEDIARTGIEVTPSALFSKPETGAGGTFVWMVDEASLTVSAREVETLGAGALGVIVRGLATGERIVTAGVNSLREGEQIRLLEDQGAPQDE
jgi:RND family efflux transporter MFP subunit